MLVNLVIIVLITGSKKHLPLKVTTTTKKTLPLKVVVSVAKVEPLVNRSVGWSLVNDQRYDLVVKFMNEEPACGHFSKWIHVNVSV